LIAGWTKETLYLRVITAHTWPQLALAIVCGTWQLFVLSN
jgi:hypothetical protein